MKQMLDMYEDIVYIYIINQNMSLRLFVKMTRMGEIFNQYHFCLMQKNTDTDKRVVDIIHNNKHLNHLTTNIP